MEGNKSDDSSDVTATQIQLNTQVWIQLWFSNKDVNGILEILFVI